MKKAFVFVLCVVLLVGLSGFADAAWYAKFDGIDGESQDKGHEDWINILSVDWGMHKPGGGATGQSRRRGDVVVEDIVVTKEMDSTTPKLAEPICKAEHFKEVKIDLCTTGADGIQHCYMKYELKNVFISSYSVSGDAEDIPIEELSLNFEEIKMTHFPQEEDGGEEPPVTAMCVA